MISVQREDFDAGAEYQRLRARDLGAIVTFVGCVRAENGIEGLYLEHYPGMTEKALARIVDDAKQRWRIGGVTVIHRVGRLAIGEQIVFVGVGSLHRGDAFAACEFIMDFLKTRAPFWKKAVYSDGERWIEAKQSDVDKANAW